MRILHSDTSLRVRQLLIAVSEILHGKLYLTVTQRRFVHKADHDADRSLPCCPCGQFHGSVHRFFARRSAKAGSQGSSLPCDRKYLRPRRIACARAGHGEFHGKPCVRFLRRIALILPSQHDCIRIPDGYGNRHYRQGRLAVLSSSGNDIVVSCTLLYKTVCGGKGRILHGFLCLVVIDYLYVTIIFQVCCERFFTFICGIVRINRQVFRRCRDPGNSPLSELYRNIRLCRLVRYGVDVLPFAFPGLLTPCHPRAFRSGRPRSGNDLFSVHFNDRDVFFPVSPRISHCCAALVGHARFRRGIAFLSRTVPCDLRLAYRHMGTHRRLCRLRDKGIFRRLFPHVKVVLFIRVESRKRSVLIYLTGIIPVGHGAFRQAPLFHKEILLPIDRVLHRHRGICHCHRFCGRRGRSFGNVDLHARTRRNSYAVLRLFRIADVDGLSRCHGKAAILSRRYGAPRRVSGVRIDFHIPEAFRYLYLFLLIVFDQVIQCDHGRFGQRAKNALLYCREVARGILQHHTDLMYRSRRKACDGEALRRAAGDLLCAAFLCTVLCARNDCLCVCGRSCRVHDPVRLSALGGGKGDVRTVCGDVLIRRFSVKNGRLPVQLYRNGFPAALIPGIVSRFHIISVFSVRIDRYGKFFCINRRGSGQSLYGLLRAVLPVFPCNLSDAA